MSFDRFKHIIRKINHRLIKLRLQPIRVFCFHQVSEMYDPLRMWECDWTQMEQLKRNLVVMKSQYTFISLSEAQKHLQKDWFRCRKYAVLTADDGYKSISNIIPWLEEQRIPITLFINTKYLDGKSWSAINEEQARRALGDQCTNIQLADAVSGMYLSKDELFALTSPLIEIGMHGHEHLDATKQSKEEFVRNIESCKKELQFHPRYIPFFAYTWGHYNEQTDGILQELNLTPVLVNGGKNYNNSNRIDRECIDGKKL